MRSTSFLSKPPPSWNEKTESLAQSRFYLMARIGPAVFQLKDDDDRTFKVVLGNPHRCTCGDAIQPCIHVAHCVIKILKVIVSHPLAYQSCWTDSDLDQVLSGDCSVTSSTRNSGNSRRLRIQRRGNQSQSEASETPEEEDTGSVARQKLDEEEDNYCPICQETMLVEEMHTVTWCRDGCGNNLHVACMVKYSQHLQNNHKSTNCPLCRAAWDLERLQRDHIHAQKVKEKLEREKLEKKKKASMYRSVPVHCSQCSCILHSTFLRCLTCTHLNFVASGSGTALPMPKLMCDLCEDCLSRSLSTGRETHISHLFLTNDASSDSPEQSWNYLRVSEARGDVVGDAIDSLPDLMTLKNKGILLDRRCRCWVCNEAVPRDAPSSVSTPCRHPVHRDCLRQEVLGMLGVGESSAVQGFHRLLRCRCGFNGCGKRIFPGLKRTIQNLASTATKPKDEATVADFQPLSACGVAFGGQGSTAESASASDREGPSRRLPLSVKLRKFTQQFREAVVSDMQLNGEGITTAIAADSMPRSQGTVRGSGVPQRRITNLRTLSQSSQDSQRGSRGKLQSLEDQNIGDLMLMSTAISAVATGLPPRQQGTFRPARPAPPERRRSFESSAAIPGESLDVLLAVRPMGGGAAPGDAPTAGVPRSHHQQPMNQRDRQRRLQQLGLSGLSTPPSDGFLVVQPSVIGTGENEGGN